MEVTVVKIKEILATVSEIPALEMVDIEHNDVPRTRVALSQEVSVGANIYDEQTHYLQSRDYSVDNELVFDQ